MSTLTPFLLFSMVAATGKLINGNWYADSIQRLAYHDVGGSGAYQRITSMDPNSGKCSSVSQPFSGSLAPFDEDVSSPLCSCYISWPFFSDRLLSFDQD
jgi:hypothetical protein